LTRFDWRISSSLRPSAKVEMKFTLGASGGRKCDSCVSIATPASGIAIDTASIGQR